ncbi:MAG: tellurium resistance protein [Rhodobacteraceae bacterium]|nr:tellurium resistance protein [Paracoccaceae bacterium]
MQAQTPLWRRTPPAIFPVSLGFLGLGLAWRNAGAALGLPTEIGDFLLGASTIFYLFFVALFVLKLAARPGVLFEDLKTPPSRSGISAMAMAMILLPAVLLQFGLAWVWLWWIGVALHVVIALLVARVMFAGAPETRSFTPFQYLTFVGLIVAPIAGVPLGQQAASFWLSMAAMVGFVIITIGYGRKLTRVLPPPPLRPSLVITLAPVSLFGLMFAQYQAEIWFQAFYLLSWILALLLLISARWLLSAGWTPVWGALTFPIAAFTNLQIVAFTMGYGVVALAGIWLGLTIGTPLILFVVIRAARAWSRGELSKMSGAATA